MKINSILWVVLCLLLVSSHTLDAQELNFRVTVDKTPSLNLVKADPQFMINLSKKIEEFVNTTQWGKIDLKIMKKLKAISY